MCPCTITIEAVRDPVGSVYPTLLLFVATAIALRVSKRGFRWSCL
jgi:hypothetical protein